MLSQNCTEMYTLRKRDCDGIGQAKGIQGADDNFAQGKVGSTVSCHETPTDSSSHSGRAMRWVKKRKTCMNTHRTVSKDIEAGVGQVMKCLHTISAWTCALVPRQGTASASLAKWNIKHSQRDVQFGSPQL